MGVAKKRKTRSTSLSFGRPPLLKTRNAATTLSSKATRSVIRNHHNLLKSHAQAVQRGDVTLARQLEINEEDLKNYQYASKTGQSKQRGGDSSAVLVDWLKDEPVSVRGSENPVCRVLEIGALSSKNEISHKTGLQITRIDLHSQEDGITQQDFMRRPLPTTKDQKFHIISLSLVLNYVSDPKARGEMLKRCGKFLIPLATGTGNNVGLVQMTNATSDLPCLFLVLPAPCLLNSRYLNEPHLEVMMRSIGFSLQRKKITSKLYYSLWKYIQPARSESTFRKKELMGGRSRNNFAIVLE